MSHSKAGFSLLELSIVLTIVSMLAVFFLTAYVARKENEKEKITVERQQEIVDALKAFRRSGNKRLPCPGDLTLTIASGNYGAEGGVPGNCTVSAPVPNYYVGLQDIVGGSVPVKALGLSDEYMYDAWGRKFFYAVAESATADCSTQTYDLEDETVGFTIRSSNTSTRTTRAWYVLISHGRNGHGAYLRSGARLSADSEHGHEQLNCHCDEDAVDTVFNTIFIDRDHEMVSGSHTNVYDDYVRYAERMHLTSQEEETQRGTETCP